MTEPASERHQIQACPRCGEPHLDVVFKPLGRPSISKLDGVEGAVRHSHWATCPTTGEPILMRWRPI